MSRASTSSDTHTINTKVNLLLYACLLATFEGGILLDPTTFCTFRFEPNNVCAMEEIMGKSYYTIQCRRRDKTARRSRPRTDAAARPDCPALGLLASIVDREHANNEPDSPGHASPEPA